MVVYEYYEASGITIAMFSYNPGPDFAAAVPLGSWRIAFLDKFIIWIMVMLHVSV